RVQNIYAHERCDGFSGWTAGTSKWFVRSSLDTCHGLLDDIHTVRDNDNTAKLNEYTKTTKTDKLPNLTFVAVGMSVGFGTLTVINSIVDRSVGPIYTKLNEQNTSIKEKFDEQNASIKGKFDEQNALIKK
ncbi:20537_t:CDS:2, partial [Funneliformis geosporum]